METIKQHRISRCWLQINSLNDITMDFARIFRSYYIILLLLYLRIIGLNMQSIYWIYCPFIVQNFSIIVIFAFLSYYIILYSYSRKIWNILYLNLFRSFYIYFLILIFIIYIKISIIFAFLFSYVIVYDGYKYMYSK